MSRKPQVVKPADRKPDLNVVGIDMTVLVSPAESSSQQITIQAGPEGVGPPPHSHNWDESFFVIRGQVQFVCAGQTTLCEAGAFVYVPGGTVHAFSFGPGGGEMLEFTSVTSKAVQFFTALDRELRPGPPDIPKLLEIAGRYGVSFQT